MVRSCHLARSGGLAPTPQPVLRTARATVTERRGLLWAVRDGRGRLGVGEASPLPGYSPDTLEECWRELAALARAPDGAEAAEVALEAVAGMAAGVAAPAARFAVETALLDLLGQHAGVPVAGLLARLARWPAAEPQERVAVNALISMPVAAADVDATLAAVARARARGVRCFKIKIGAHFARELDVLRAVRARHGADVTLRLDANQAWTAREAAEHLAWLRDIAPEYVEEPCRDAGDLAAMAPAGPAVPVALDESLATAAPRLVDELLARGRVRALVLKPMLLGGALRCLELAARARAHGALAVASHLLDGPVALAACAHLALVLGHTCGLDRHPGLDCWPAVDLPVLGPAHVRLPEGPGLGLDPVAVAALWHPAGEGDV